MPLGSRGLTSALLTVAAGLQAAAVTAAPQAAADDELRQRVEAYQRVWNTRDTGALAGFFTEDADMVMGNLPAARGRAAIEASWRAYFERQEPERRGSFVVTSARRLTPTVALVDVDSTTSGEAGGESLPVRRARGTWVLRLEAGAWMIEAMRGMPTPADRVELTPSLETARSLRPQIRAFVDEYEDTFNRHDADALTALYREDADLIVRERPVARGAEAIRAWWRAYFSRPRPYRALMIVDEIRMIAEDVALVGIVATGAPLQPGVEPVPVRQAAGTWVLVREETGAWRVAAIRVLPGRDDRIIRTIGP